MSPKDIILIYDKECPACNNYCQVVQILKSVGELKIMDGLDIDQGMVLKMGGSLYYGSDAIHALSLISSRSGVFNRLNYWMFKSKTISKLLYPVLRFFRNLLLKMLGKSKINNLKQPDNENF